MQRVLVPANDLLKNHGVDRSFSREQRNVDQAEEDDEETARRRARCLFGVATVELVVDL